MMNEASLPTELDDGKMTRLYFVPSLLGRGCSGISRSSPGSGTMGSMSRKGSETSLLTLPLTTGPEVGGDCLFLELTEEEMIGGWSGKVAGDCSSYWCYPGGGVEMRGRLKPS